MRSRKDGRVPHHQKRQSLYLIDGGMISLAKNAPDDDDLWAPLMPLATATFLPSVSLREMHHAHPIVDSQEQVLRE